MSLEQFFLPPREWCESKLNENRRYFHLFSQKTVESINKIVFGRCYHGHSRGADRVKGLFRILIAQEKYLLPAICVSGVPDF
jgi:hypothetical protein